MTALKFSSKCSFITNKLRFFVEICLVLPALMTFFNSLLELAGTTWDDPGPEGCS